MLAGPCRDNRWRWFPPGSYQSGATVFPVIYNRTVARENLSGSYSMTGTKPSVSSRRSPPLGSLRRR